MSDEMIKALSSLTWRTGMSAETIWPILMKQARVEMWVHIAISVACAMVAALAGSAVISVLKEGKAGARWQFYGYLSTATVAVTSCLICVTFALMEGMNPEYWALMRIAEVLK